MQNDRFELRQAIVDDARELGTLHVKVWRETYTGSMRGDFLEGLVVAEWIAMWQKSLVEDDGSRTIIAVDTTMGDEIVGFASAGPSRDKHPLAETELYVLNTDARCHGSGIGAVLLESVLLNGSASLWVVEDNTRAQAFYRKHRFRVEGTKKWDEQSGVNDVRMVRPGAPKGE